MATMNAQKIREFFATLFGSRRIEDLKAALERTEHEAWYRVLDLKEQHKDERDALNATSARAIGQLLEMLAKTEKERDYFRARADRLELMLLSPVRLGLEAPAKRSSAPPSATNSAPVGRKPWPVIQAEWAEEQAQEAAREKATQDKAAALKVS